MVQIGKLKVGGKMVKKIKKDQFMTSAEIKKSGLEKKSCNGNNYLFENGDEVYVMVKLQSQRDCYQVLNYFIK